MSFPLVARIWEYRFQPSERAVLQAMADHADADGGRVWPSIARIAWKTDYSERQVQRCIHGLVTSGVLVIVKPASGRRPTEYRVNLDAAERKPAFNGKGDTMSPRHHVTPDTMSPIQPRKDDTMSPLPNRVGVTSATPRGDTVSPESTNEPTKRINTPPVSLRSTSPKPKKRIPEDFVVTEGMIADAMGYGVPYAQIAFETEAWRDYHDNKQDEVNSPAASWRTWMRNHVKFAAKDAARGSPAKANGQYLTAAEKSQDAFRKYHERITKNGTAQGDESGPVVLAHVAQRGVSHGHG